MKKKVSREYHWYLLSCEDAGEAEPLSAEAFWLLYRRYRLFRPLLLLVEDRGSREEPPRKTLWLFRPFYRILRSLMALNELGRRVKAGRRLDHDGGAPVPARPRTPVLVGAGAKLLPPLDPEPDVRDP